MGSRNRQGEPLLLLLDRLDVIIELLHIQLGGVPAQTIQSVFPDLSKLYANGGTTAQQSKRLNLLLEYLIAASLPSAPENVRPMVIGTTEAQLAENQSQPLMRVDVSNLNVAQPLRVSKQGVSLTSNMQVLARQTVPFVLPVGSKLYGIVELGTIEITVSQGYDIQPMLDRLLAAEL